MESVKESSLGNMKSLEMILVVHQRMENNCTIMMTGSKSLKTYCQRCVHKRDKIEYNTASMPKGVSIVKRCDGYGGNQLSKTVLGSIYLLPFDYVMPCKHEKRNRQYLATITDPIYVFTIFYNLLSLLLVALLYKKRCLTTNPNVSLKN